MCVCLYRFWERRPGFALTGALFVATGCSTMFSLIWPFPPDTSKYLNMKPLSHSYAALMVWIYVLLWFVGQDITKMITYYFILKYQSEDDFEKKLRDTKARIASQMEADSRQTRLAGEWAVGFLCVPALTCVCVCSQGPPHRPCHAARRPPRLRVCG